MSVFPHSHLFHNDSRTIVISGPHIQVLDTQTGNVVHSTTSLDDTGKQAVIKSGPVRCAAVDRAFETIVTTGDDKKLKVWKLNGLTLLSERELPKKPTAIRFTRNGQTILVSDKFGDVFSYPLQPESAAPASSLVGAPKRDTLTSHENPSNGALILGHASLLTSFLLTEDEKYIVTADRDEHIRISWYPQGYVIERYCLGHKKFVSAVHIPQFEPSILISGGGDPVLKIWDWMSGKHLDDIPILDAVEPFIKVKPPPGRWGRSEGEDGTETPEGTGRRRRKGRGKGTAVAEGIPADGDAETPKPEEDEGAEENGEMVVERDFVMQESEPGTTDIPGPSRTSTAPGRSEVGDSAQQAEPAPVFVLHRIESVDLGGHGRHLIFSAVGATALFYCSLSTHAGSHMPPTIHSYNFGKPVIDFALRSDNQIWIFFDGEWRAEGADGEKADMVRALQWVENKLVEVAPSSAPPLLSSLNSKCLIPAAETDLKALDLYNALASMPKNVDAEHDPMREGPLDTGDLETVSMSLETVAEKQKGQGRGRGKGKGKGAEPTQRELARMKNKLALAAKIQERKVQDREPSAVEAERSGCAVGAAEDGPEKKRARSETAENTTGTEMDET